MHPSRGSETVERLSVRLGESLLSLQDTRVDFDNARVVLPGIIDGHRISERRVGVEEVLRSRGEGDPLGRRRDRSHHLTHRSPSFLNRSRRARAAQSSAQPTMRGFDGTHFHSSKVDQAIWIARTTPSSKCSEFCCMMMMLFWRAFSSLTCF